MMTKARKIRTPKSMNAKPAPAKNKPTIMPWVARFSRMPLKLISYIAHSLARLRYRQAATAFGATAETTRGALAWHEMATRRSTPHAAQDHPACAIKAAHAGCHH